jgi:hypothetical protein
MADQKLLLLLQTLTPAEHIQFTKFLDSPFHNQREDCIHLYRYLKWEIAAGILPEMEAIHAFQQRGGPERSGHADRPLAASGGEQTRLTMNYLLRRVERFLALRDLLADEAALELRVLDIYRKRKLGKLFEGQLIRIRNREQRGLPQNEDHFLRQYHLESTRFNAVTERSQASEEALQKLNLALDQYYILQKLKAACSALTLSKLFPSAYTDPMLPRIIQHIEAQNLHQVPAIGLFFAAYLVLANTHADESTQAFHKLKSLLPQSTQIFADEDCRALHRIALNHCIRQINRGDRHYLAEAFDLYVAGLQSGALLENGTLSPWTYKNIAAAGLRIGQLDWVAGFIDSYRDQVPAEFRDAFHQYNLAELALARGEYQTVVRHLRDLSFKDPFMTLNARVAQIKAHYELQEYKLIEYHLPNLQALLRRRALQSYHRENYRNFVRYLGALLNLKDGDQPTAQRLIADMEGEEHLSELDWLRRKVLEAALTAS